MTILESFRQPPEKKIPAALVAAFLLQTAGALFWAGSAAERIAGLERACTSISTMPPLACGKKSARTKTGFMSAGA
jgi:hypothetical protein